MKKFSLILLLITMLFACKKESFKMNPVGKVSDADGQTYLSHSIDKDTWMLSNLNVSRFRNGDPIMQVTSKDEWQSAILSKTPAWCYYNYDPANGEKYGKIYNWFAVKDYRGLAPEGWVIPSHAQWSALVTFLGGSWEAGGKIKSRSAWKKDDSGTDGNGTDDFMFNSLPGGTVFSTGDFYAEGTLAKYWSSTINEEEYAVYHALMSSKNKLLNQFTTSIDNGMYVRCVQYKQ